LTGKTPEYFGVANKLHKLFLAADAAAEAADAAAEAADAVAAAAAAAAAEAAEAADVRLCWSHSADENATASRGESLALENLAHFTFTLT
jgi:hypothetical protein